MKKIAVMQPYIFPYIGYFQMVNTVDTFVFYDDVNFIKRGWVNRNKILVNGGERLISFPCIKASQNKLINEIEINLQDKTYNKILNSIELTYKKAPYFESIFPLIRHILETPTDKISILTRTSVTEIADYLEIPTKFKISSIDFPETKGLEKANRLIEICKKENAEQYINALGGKELYNKSFFRKNGIQLDFIKTLPLTYKQFKNEFVPSLSIIDVLMFNNKKEVQTLLTKFTLV